jgi:hypothetical protein
MVLRVEGGALPTVKIYVPIDGVGPTLASSIGTKELEQPPGYDTVHLRGSPRRGAHPDATGAGGDAEAALELAATNRFSDIYFNLKMQPVFAAPNPRQAYQVRLAAISATFKPT